MVARTVEVLDVGHDVVGRLRSERENVVWLSRHPLIEEQVEAISFLHQNWVRIERHSITFASARHLVDCINYFSEDGSYVYLVAPNYYLEELKTRSSQFKNFRFRKFKGYILAERTNNSFNIIECENYDGVSRERSVFSSRDLSKLKLRQLSTEPLAS